MTFRSLKAQLCNFRHDFFKATEVLDNDVSGIYNYLLSPLYYRIPDAIANNYIKFILPTSDLLLKYVTELTGEKAKRGRGDTARGKRCEKKKEKKYRRTVLFINSFVVNLLSPRFVLSVTSVQQVRFSLTPESSSRFKWSRCPFDRSP